MIEPDLYPRRNIFEKLLPANYLEQVRVIRAGDALRLGICEPQMPAGLNYASNLLHGNGSLKKEFGSIAKMSIRKKTGGGNATLV
jgi:hypothetical protein